MVKEQQIERTSTRFMVLAIILLVSSIGQVSSDLYMPSLPAMSKALMLSNHWVQFTVSVYMFGFCCSQLIYGPLSDAIGRKKPLIFGLILNIVGSALCALSPNIYLIYLGRLLQGLGVGAGTALGRAMLRDLFCGEHLAKYGSYVSMSTVLIFVTAPVLGGYIQTYAGWRFNFLFLTIYSILILILYTYKLGETNQHFTRENFSPRRMLDNSKQLLTSKQYLRFALCALLSYAGIMAWITAAPIVLQDHIGISAAEFGWIYLCAGAGFAGGGLMNASFVTRYGIQNMLIFGLILELCAGLTMSLLFLLGYMNIFVIVLPIFVFMLGTSFVFPNAVAGAFNPFPKIAGMAGAIFGFLQMFGGTISSSIISILPDHNQFPIGLAFTLLALIGLGFYYLLSE